MAVECVAKMAQVRLDRGERTGTPDLGGKTASTDNLRLEQNQPLSVLGNGGGKPLYVANVVRLRRNTQFGYEKEACAKGYSTAWGL